MVDHRKTQPGQIIQRLAVPAEGRAVGELNVEDNAVQTALCSNFGVQLAEGAGGGVSGVCHQGFTALLPQGVQFLEHGAGHIALAPDDEPVRGVFDF